jgi:hypothetical protein
MVIRRDEVSISLFCLCALKAPRAHDGGQAVRSPEVRVTPVFVPQSRDYGVARSRLYTRRDCIFPALAKNAG